MGRKRQLKTCCLFLSLLIVCFLLVQNMYLEQEEMFHLRRHFHERLFMETDDYKICKNCCLNADFKQEHSVSIWTLLTDNPNYVRGALTLGRSILRHKTIETDLVVMELKSKPLSVSNWTALYAVGWKRCVVNRIEPRDEQRIYVGYRDQYTKLHLWRMTSYETVLYFDSDTLIVGNIDPLILIKLPTRSIGVSRDIMNGEWLKTFNMGVFLIHPNITEYDRLLRLKNDTSFKFVVGWSEQGFLNEVYKNCWSEIGFINNANVAVFSQRKIEWEVSKYNIRVIHYTLGKPWSCPDYYSELCNLWRDATIPANVTQRRLLHV